MCCCGHGFLAHPLFDPCVAPACPCPWYAPPALDPTDPHRPLLTGYRFPITPDPFSLCYPVATP